MAKKMARYGKYCIVPQCFNSTVKTPDKLFFYVPMDPKMRKKWMTAVKRVDTIRPKTIAHCCEDHFDVENDMANYIRHRLMGGRLKLKEGVVPHKFDCQRKQNHNISEVFLVACKEEFERADSPPQEQNPIMVEVSEAAYEEDEINEVGVEFERADSPPQKQQVLVVRRQLCRGCLSDGAFCSLQSTTGGESYASLLQTYCNIELCRVQSEALRAICALCAARLREARAFSEQARAAEARFAALHAQGRVRALADDIEIKTVDPDPIEDDRPGSIKEEICDSYDEDTEVTTGTSSPIFEEPNRSNKDAKTKPEKKLLRKESYERVKLKPNLQSIRRHQWYHTAKEKGRKCNVCEKTFATDSLVTEHQLQCKRSDDKVPKGESTNKKEAQIKPKTEQKRKLALCPLCGKLQPRNRLIKHMWNHKRTQKERSCNVCEKTFATPSLAREHRLQEHAITDTVQCKACGKFITKPFLKDHMGTIHNLGVKRQCPQCDYVGYSVRALRRHLLVHKTEKEHHCSYCKKSYKSRNALRVHERIHTGERNKEPA